MAQSSLRGHQQNGWKALHAFLFREWPSTCGYVCDLETILKSEGGGAPYVTFGLRTVYVRARVLALCTVPSMESCAVSVRSCVRYIARRTDFKTPNE